MRRSLLWALALPLAALAAWAASPLNLTKALEAQRRLVAQRPDDAGAYNDLGNLLQMAGDAAAAEDAYRRALELDPTRVSARFNLGLLLQQRGEPRRALRHYREVVEQQPGHAWAHFQIGTLREAAGDESGAVDAYALAFRLDPQLAFPEVNPQVLASDLVTQAMLRAYRGPDTESLPPPIYEQPNRIAALLVPPVQAPAAPAESGVTDVAGAAPEGGAARPGTAAPQAGQPETRVLRPGSLQGRGVNQASPQAGARGRARGGFVPPAGPDWSRPDPEGRHDEDSFEQPMEEPVEPPSTTVVIRPGIQSTGRLELDVAVPPRPVRQGQRAG